MAVAAPPVTPAAATTKQSGRVERRRRIGEKWYTPYLFILPHMIVFGIMIGIAFFFSAFISFFNWDLLNPDVGSQPFVGVDNYAQLFDPSSLYFERFWTDLWNTVIFVLMSVPALVVIGLVLAALLNQKFRGRNFFRSVYFAPWTLSVAVIGLLWKFIFETGGILDRVVLAFGGTPPAWLTTQPWAWLAIVIATLWWTIGFNTIILLAGMQSISADLYEAASIDGANVLQQFRHITIPSLRPILLLVITLQVIASFNLVGQPQIITEGGPAPGETTPVLLFITGVAFTSLHQPGIAAAMALIVALIMIVVSVINFRFFQTERA
jgi:multiple sugar transport system permease protein